MVFRNFTRNLGQKINHFAGNILPGAIHRGASFFNNKILPAVKLGHKLIQHATNEIANSDIIEPHHKQRAKTVAQFSDLGLQKLQDIGVQAGHLSQKYGKAHVMHSPENPTAPI